MEVRHNSPDIVTMLQDHGIKPTQQRLQIAGVLFAKPQHLSADQILEMVNAEDDLVSKATVYNTLGLFTRMGLIREVIIDPAKVFYDSTTHPHHHIYNTDTGTLMDLDETAISIMGLPVPPTGTVIEGIDVVVRVRSDASAVRGA